MSKNLRRGRLLLTQTTKRLDEAKWNQFESEERQKLFTDFFESNEGRSRQLVCTFNPIHPEYQTLPDLICKAVNNHDKLVELLESSLTGLEIAINVTPTGEFRNTLTQLNIDARLLLNSLNEANT